MLEKLKEIIKLAGEELLSLRSNKMFNGHWDKTQFKAEADLKMHNFICELLNKNFDNIPIVSEEDEKSFVDNRPEKYFLIDPIDGTASFVNGFDGFVTQIAYIENKEVIVGVIFAPVLNELYFAQKNKGAFLNDKQIFIDQNPKENVLIDNYPEPKGFAKVIFDKFNFDGYVECGSIALKICKVVSNSATVFVKDVEIKDWDIAPADIIVNEAGGYLCDIMGNEFKYENSYAENGIIVSKNKKECEKYAQK